ncbi:MAG: diaminopimelate epimerase [Prevotella sp.]|nr:diaminopimelate epimerase [Prevotella sp.]
MTNTIAFTKMHGAGNDYIYVNTLLYSIPDPAKASIEWSRPHFGIGSDGLVLICKPTTEAADYRMRIFNADGSEAMMCGNASRCIGKYLYEKGMTRKSVIRLETASGIKILNLHIDKEDTSKVDSVTVDMLEPRLDAEEQYDGSRVDGTFVSMGNPHFVLFTDEEPSDQALTNRGRALEHDKAFPQRCNIEFAVQKSKNEFRTRVWERGSGITMACGTGACATAVAAITTGRADRKKPVKIVMDGGTLTIEWRDDNHIYMTGPAAFAFEGTIQLSE